MKANFAILSATLVAIFSSAVYGDNTFVIQNATGTFAPSFRGGPDSTWLGWDTFDDGGSGLGILNDSTPDIGSDAGILATTNGEDHISGSGNYYSSFGSVAEDLTFAVATGSGGFTTVIVQGNTLFGGFGTPFVLSDVGGVSPTMVSGFNAAGSGQFFAKYKIPGSLSATETLQLNGGGFTSFGALEVDTFWSPAAFANVSAVAVPEPLSATLISFGLCGLLMRRNRR